MTSFTREEQENLAARLMRAVESLDVSQVAELLAEGVPADVWDISYDGDFPLQRVARFDGPEALAIAKALIDAGADVDHKGDFRFTALARAVDADESNRIDWDMAQYLITAGVDPTIQNEGGLTPAECASSEGRPDAVLAMLKAGMDPNVSGPAGPLIWYCAWDDPVVVKALLARGVAADSESKPIVGRSQTPLQRAVEAFANGGDQGVFLEIAVALIDGGADLSRLEAVPGCLESFLLADLEKSALIDSTPLPPDARARSERTSIAAHLGAADPRRTARL